MMTAGAKLWSQEWSWSFQNRDDMAILFAKRPHLLLRTNRKSSNLIHLCHLVFDFFIVVLLPIFFEKSHRFFLQFVKIRSQKRIFNFLLIEYNSMETDLRFLQFKRFAMFGYIFITERSRHSTLILCSFESTCYHYTWLGQDWGQPQPGYIELC